MRPFGSSPDGLISEAGAGKEQQEIFQKFYNVFCE